MSDNSAQIGYDWKPANKRKPRCNEVLRFRRAKNIKTSWFMMDNLLAMWDGNNYHIFNVQTLRWEDYDYYFAYTENHETPAPLADFEYAYVPPKQTQYVPFYALAYNRRKTV